MLTGTVERVVFHNEESGYSIVLVRVSGERQTVPVLGVTVQPQPGEMIRAEGSWTEDRTWGRQFKAERIELVAPSSPTALKDYLAAGALKGVGRSLAKRMFSKFGDRLAEIIECQPERLAEVGGIGPRMAKRIGLAWKDQAAARNTLIFLQGHGINAATARRIFDRYGAAATDKIVADPYLLAREIRGIGFATADRLAQSLGIEKDAPTRLIAGLEHILTEAETDGQVAVSRGHLVQRTAVVLDCPGDGLEEALNEAVSKGYLVYRQTESRELVLLKSLDQAEVEIVQNLTRLRSRRVSWEIDGLVEAVDAFEAKLGHVLAPEQRNAVLGSLANKLNIITGGPGTGKTTIVRVVVDVLSNRTDAVVLLAAPTGRAARRLAASCGRQAWTLHRLLEADPGRGFGRHREQPLECDVLVIDEMSMVDTLLFAATLEALPVDASLLLVGDADQLPSIGPGQILADLIAASGINLCPLNQVFRQGSESSIVANAHRIRQGQQPIYARAEEEPGDLYGIRADSPQDIQHLLLELVTNRMPLRFELDPIHDIQVITPTNKGSAGTRDLNELLQGAINPNPIAFVERGGTRYGIGDKVMQLENDYQREVSNGDIGIIVKIDEPESLLEVEIDNRRVAYGFSDLGQLTLAYAITVHKSQGSEYPAVIVVVAKQHGRMLQRRLIYTAVTRARRLVVLLGQQDAIKQAIETAGAGRTTLLPWRLKQEALTNDGRDEPRTTF